MSEVDLEKAIQRRYAPSAIKPDYRQKLKRARTATNEEVREEASSSSPPLERVRAVNEKRDMQSATVQSVLVAALQVLHRVRHREEQVADACLSKGQGEKFSSMIAAIDDLDQAFRDTLNKQGAKMLDLTLAPSDEDSDETSWWFTLTEALQTIEEDIEWIIALVARQPKGSTGRALSGVIVRLLHRHYNVLLVEAEQWME